jgi:hypothetical protein
LLFWREKSAYLSVEICEKTLNGLLENALTFLAGFFEESLDGATLDQSTHQVALLHFPLFYAPP